MSPPCDFIFVLMMGQFMAIDFARQNSPGILRSRKRRHRIKLLGKTRSLNLIKREKKSQRNRRCEDTSGGKATLPRTDGSDGNTENGWLAKLLFCVCLVLPSSLQLTEAQQKRQQVFHTEGSHHCHEHRGDYGSYQHAPGSPRTFHLHLHTSAAAPDAAAGKTQSSFPFAA